MPTESELLARCEACGWSMRPWHEELLAGMPSKCRQCGSDEICVVKDAHDGKGS
jgi:predicted Zn-ribbon and HTH transcriptional regulator